MKVLWLLDKNRAEFVFHEFGRRSVHVTWEVGRRVRKKARWQGLVQGECLVGERRHSHGRFVIMSTQSPLFLTVLIKVISGIKIGDQVHGLSPVIVVE
jgi:hypothetical protein